MPTRLIRIPVPSNRGSSFRSARAHNRQPVAVLRLRIRGNDVHGVDRLRVVCVRISVEERHIARGPTS